MPSGTELHLRKLVGQMLCKRKQKNVMFSMQFSVGDNFACIYACRVLIFFGVVSKPLHSSFIQNQESAHHHKLITTVYVARVHSHKPSVTTIVIFSITSKNNFRLSNPKCHLDGRLAFPRTPSSHLHNLTLTVPATRRLY